MPSSDPITALAETDPKKVGKQEFVELLEAASAVAARDGGVDLSALDPEQFAKLISRASAKQLQAVMSRPELAEQIVDEVFRRMETHFKGDRAQDTDAVVRWRITVDPENPVRYECVLAAGICTVNKNPDQPRQPRATITVGPIELLRLAAGNATAPMLFMTGKIKVAGDIAFAAGLTSLFQIPTA